MKITKSIYCLTLAFTLAACGIRDDETKTSQSHSASATSTMKLSAAAPTIIYTVASEVVSYSRQADNGVLRNLPTKIYYPAASTSNSAVAQGKFPLILFSHGLEGNYDTYWAPINLLVQAGFIVAAPEYPNTKTGSQWNYDDAWWGAQSQDASQVITKVLERNTIAGDKFAGHIDIEPGVGVAGHSLGGVTTNGLLGLKRDARITSAIVYAGGSVANFSGPPVKVLFQHGDNDDIESLPYWRAKQIYNEVPSSWPKAFLTHIGGGHWEYLWPSGPSYNQTTKTMIDWFRWSLYGDADALARLPADAQSSRTTWESAIPSIHIEAENFTSNNGVWTEACSEGGINVGWIDNGDWMTWDVNIPASGAYTIQYRVSSPWDGGKIQFEKAGGYPIYGILNVPYTGGWQSWTTISHRVTLPAGQQTIAIHALSGGFNINWIKITP